MEIKRAEMTMATIRAAARNGSENISSKPAASDKKRIDGRMWRNLVNTGIVCLLLGGTVSCGRTDVYNEFNTLPKNGWFKRDVQRFTPEVPDTVNRYDVYLSLRHNGDYTYRNLWLFVSYNDEGGVLKTDTVNCELADEFGRWSGGGWGSYYQQEVLLNDDFRFSGEKEHVFTVQQAMRDDRIRGISDVGIRIVPHEEK